jgi:hypothetical protein
MENGLMFPVPNAYNTNGNAATLIIDSDNVVILFIAELISIAIVP